VSPLTCVWCGGPSVLPGPGGVEHCSEACERAAMMWAVEYWDAVLSGGEPPSRAEIDRRVRRSERWTPEAMERRTREIEEAAGLEGVEP